MPNGTIRITTAAASQAVPVSDVAITVLDENGGAVATLRTGDNGQSEVISLPAPDRSYSLDPDNTTVRPYAVYTLTATKEGWRTLRLQGVQVFDGQETQARLEMLPDNEADTALARIDEETIVIPPHSLFAGNDTDGGSARSPRLTCPARVLPEVVVPKKITVHLGAPKASATNVSVDFQSYIATVASCEVYPTWAGYTSQKFLALRNRCGGHRLR